MTPSQILKALSRGHEHWPADALEAASAERSALSALLLEKLTQGAAEIEKLEAAGFPKPSVKRFLKTPSPLFYGVFLLADWREQAAYRPLARLMRFPWVSHDHLLGEPAVEEPGYQLTAAVFDGDPKPIFDIILDLDADSSVRFWQWHALTLIALEGKLDRAVAADFARRAFVEMGREAVDLLVWSGWEKLISRLALTDLAPLVRKAHESELLVESTYEEFQRDLEYAIAHPDAPCRPGDELLAFGGVQKELSPWVGL